MFAIFSARAAFTESCFDQGYTITAPEEAEGDANNSAGVTEWLAGLSGGYGAFLVVSHGLSYGMAVEAYKPESDRNTAWFALPDTTDYYRNSSEDGYHISMWAEELLTHYVSANSIVYNFTCYGHNYQSWWTGARVRLGYYDSHPRAQAIQDLVTIWPRLADWYDPDYRSIEQAVSGTGISVDGFCNTTLTPFVSSTSVNSGSRVADGGTDVTIDFDTETNEGSSPLSVGWPFSISNVQWINNAEVKCHVTPIQNAVGGGYLVPVAATLGLAERLVITGCSLCDCTCTNMLAPLSYGESLA